MKLLLLFAAIGYTSAAVTCDECKDAAAGLVDRLTSEASIAEQTEVLIAALCPASPDPVMCEKGMNMWWGAMAHCLYPHFIGAGDVCSRLGSARRDQCSPSLRTGPVRSALQSWRGSAPS